MRRLRNEGSSWRLLCFPCASHVVEVLLQLIVLDLDAFIGTSQRAGNAKKDRSSAPGYQSLCLLSLHRTQVDQLNLLEELERRVREGAVMRSES